MDSSDENQSIGHSQTDIASATGSEALEEPKDDLRSVVQANKCAECIAKSRCSSEEAELIIEGHTLIMINKETLRTASSYFATLLKYNENQIRMVPPANVHLDCYVAVLRSVSNNEPLAVDESNMWDFLVLSRYFLMKPLEDTCSRVIRQALPTLTMDELCRLWRNAHAGQCDDVKKWYLTGIVRYLDQAGQSVEFLNFDFGELLDLLRDAEFFPLFEKDVYKAIVSWCDHNPEQRMTRAILGEINWDHFDSHTIQELMAGAPPPLQSVLQNIVTSSRDRKKPKRAVERHVIFCHEAFVQRKREKRRTRELLHYDCLRGTLRVWQAPAARTVCTKGSWRYLTHDLSIGQPTVIFLKKHDSNRYIDVVADVNLLDGSARLLGSGLIGGYFMEMVMGGFDVSLYWCYQKTYGYGFDMRSWEWELKPFQCKELERVASCSLELPGADGKSIAHLVSFFRWDKSYKLKGIPDSAIGFCDKHKDFFTDFQLLPALPAPRLGAAIIQCGTFLFVTGGSDMTNDNVELPKQCYRLDLTARDHWERIGDLSVPRVDHCMFIRSGKVFVYGGSTLDAENKKKKVALMSFETYDPYADIWTAFDIPLTGGGQREVGRGYIGDRDQTTYCLDLGASLDETKYRDIIEPIN